MRWVRRRKVPKPTRASRPVLRRSEVLPTLAGFPAPSSESPWQWIPAACLYAGLRPGEALGLKKEDIDAREWTMTVRHSWTAPLPKDGDAREVLVVKELRSFLEAAMAASPSDFVFARPDGSPFTPEIRFQLVDHLRRSLKRAGVVDGFRHICRRKGCGFVETRREASEDRCPKCNMRLWVSPVARRMRFYDLRHTHATLLRKAGVDLGAVQRTLGHSSGNHLRHLLSQRRGGLPRRGRAGPHVRRSRGEVNAPVMQGAEMAQNEGPEAAAFARNLGAFHESGRLDLNQRPLAPQASALPGCATPRALQGGDR